MPLRRNKTRVEIMSAHATGGSRRQFILSSLAMASASLVATRSVAQTRKAGDRPIRVIVPFAAGGGVDVFARLLSEKLRQKSGMTFIVENRAGANGSIGGNVVKNAEPDGTTLLFSAGTHVMAQQVMKSAPYDPIDDFASIARVGEAPMMLVVSPKVAANSIGELIAEARKAPEKWTLATSALGAPGHLAELDFNRLSGLNLLIQPYRGTAPALNDIAGGHVQMMIDPVLALLPLATSKQVKGLAVTTAKRTPLAPDFPTASESGLAGMDHSSWYGVWGPKKLSPDLVAQLNDMINNAIGELKSEGQLAKLGIEPVSETASQFETFARNYLARNAELLKASSFEPI
jgi:tripartite-type tricarboxylate transporter receptor subunit TctC